MRGDATTPLPFVWPYAVVFWAVYIWAFLPEFGLIRRSPVRGAPAPAEDQGSLRVLVMGGSVLMLGTFVIPFFAPHAVLPGNRAAWFFVGVVVLVLGSLLRRHCFRVLGKYFTGAVTVQADHRVITAGAYRWVRHPSYSAALILFGGIGLSLGNWVSLAVSLVVGIVLYTYRAGIEERALVAALGAPYAEFMATRKRFIPFIY